MSSPLTKEEVTAFAGKNADYYWTRWTPLIQGQDWTGFNWAAFFLTGPWLAYRKMYPGAVIFFSVMLLGVLANTLSDRTNSASSTVGWLTSLVCGAFGNRWYWSHASELVENARGQGLGEDNLSDRLSKCGGTSILSAVISLVFFLLSLF